MRRVFWFLTHCAAAVLIAVLLMGWLQALHPAFDSFSHFRLIFVALLAFVFLILVLGRRWRSAGISVAAILMSLYLSVPYLPGFAANDTNQTMHSDGTALRVVQMNLRFNNPTPELAVEQLERADADIMLLQEVTLTTQPVLFAFKFSHPHQLSCQIRGVGSVAILSKHPFIEGPSKKCARFFGYATAKILVGGKTVTLASFHSRWPWPAGQQRQIERLQPEFEVLSPPLILAGDFNAAPWSAVVQKVARKTNTQPAPGLRLTWAPRFVEFKTRIGGLLPIDHLLTSPEIVVQSQTVLDDGGSDHFPIVSELVLPN